MTTQLPISKERLGQIASIYGKTPSLHETQMMAQAILAAYEQEPVFFVEIEGDDWINAGRIEGKERPDLGLLPDGINYLYAHSAPSIPTAAVAAPAPVTTSFRDGIEAAAKWIDQQREAFDSEHGRVDLDTGTFEFGNDAQLEYSGMLVELAEGIRALHPNAGGSQVMPDYEGTAMTQRECYRAGFEAAMLKSKESDLDTAKLINKFYERYPLATFSNDTDRSAALGYFMAGAELQCFGQFIVYEDANDGE